MKKKQTLFAIPNEVRNLSAAFAVSRHERDIIAISLEFQYVTRPNAHLAANLTRQGDSPSAKHSGLLFHKRAIVPPFFHLVGPCPKNNELNHR